MCFRNDHRHTGMDLRHQLIGFACDNRASTHPFIRLRIFPVFTESGKGERPSVFYGDRERQLWFNRFTPFVKSICGNQAAAFGKRLAERRCFIYRFSSGVDGPVAYLRVFGPVRNQSPLQGVERSYPSFWIESDRQNFLTRRNAVTDGQIRLLWDRNMIEPGELFFGCGSTITAAHRAQE